MTLAHSGIAAFFIVHTQHWLTFANNKYTKLKSIPVLKMAFGEGHVESSHWSNPFARWSWRLSTSLARRRAYKRAYAELNALTTRQLDDLGISRSMISRLASEAASKT